MTETKPKKLIHGRPNTYTQHKCRCDKCRAAISQYQNNHRKRLHAAAMWAYEHGYQD